MKMEIRTYFPEFIHMVHYVRENGIKNWDYKFTFAYGYELIVLDK